MNDADSFFAARTTIRRLQRLTQPCAGGCGKKLPEVLRLAYCPICWNVNRACEAEGVGSLAELRSLCLSRHELLWRVADVLRRAAVEDAEKLIAELHRRTR